MLSQFSRTQLLLGREGMEKLADARVAVFGIGGVGGHTVEALARSGVGALDLIDDDTVSLTNLNRQMMATLDTVGMHKTDAAAARIHSINPDCRVTCHRLFYMPEMSEALDLTQFDYVVDAIDTVSSKIALIRQADRCGVPIISSMGAGNKLDPTAFRVTDIYKTAVCPLARIMRHELKKYGIQKLKVVYSEELPLQPEPSEAAGIVQEESLASGRSGTPKTRIPGSVSFVPSVVGLILAGEVIKDLTGIREHRG